MLALRGEGRIDGAAPALALLVEVDANGRERGAAGNDKHGERGREHAARSESGENGKVDENAVPDLDVPQDGVGDPRGARLPENKVLLEVAAYVLVVPELVAPDEAAVGNQDDEPCASNEGAQIHPKRRREGATKV